MADLNSTAQEALRAYRASSGEAQQAIDEVVKARPGRLRQKALDKVQGVLTDGDVDANVLKLFQSGQKAIKDATSAAYKKVFASGGNIGDDGAELVTDIWLPDMRSLLCRSAELRVVSHDWRVESREQ